MYEYKTKQKILSLLLVFSLLVMTTVLVFPSPALAYEQWDYPGGTILLDSTAPFPPWEYTLYLTEVNKVILEVAKPILIDDLVVELEVEPFITYEDIVLDCIVGVWLSTTHTINVTYGPESDIIEVPFASPLPQILNIRMAILSPSIPTIINISQLSLVYSLPNQAPVANNDSASVAEGGTVTSLNSGDTSVLDNDSDPDDLMADLTASLVISPAHGVLILNSDGTFQYIHDGSETTSDSFTYEVCDDGSPPGCDTATVTITITPVNDPPELSIDDVLAFEGDANATFTVSLSNPSSQDVTVNYATADGTAEAFSDYTATSGTLTIPAGETTGTISVLIVEDDIYEGDETFYLNLSDATNSTISDGEGMGTILDNDQEPTLSINDVTVIEDAGVADFTVSLSSPSAFPVTVDYATADGTATAGTDYTGIATPGTLTFAPGEVDSTISVPIIDDLIYEGNETFSLNLSNPVNATIGDDQGIGTILDNDQEPALSIDDVTVNEDGGDAIFAVTLSHPSSFPVTVDYSTANGTAIAGSDYTAASGTLTIPAGETTGTISVPIIDDFIYESDETFSLNLSNPTNATISDDQGIGTIVDNDQQPTLSINDVIVIEGGGVATFTVSLSNPSSQDVTVNYATADGTAEAFSDYTATSGALTIPADMTTGTISVPIIDDLMYEGDETFYLNLSNPVNATIIDGEGMGTILDNDQEPTLSINDVTVIEGGGVATFTVSLSNPSYEDVTVDYDTSDGTATAISHDYTATLGTLTIPADMTTGTISVPIIDDFIYEGDETFYLNLSNPVNATIIDGEGIGTILNDDLPPELMVEALIDLVDDNTDIPEATKTSLTASLNTALKVLNDSNQKNDVVAINGLEAFINKIEAQRGKKIPALFADELISNAMDIITVLNAET